jgi:hypothetical protein
MDSAGSTRALPRVGFPIRKSPGQRLVSTSPGLIAAAHVLHRLLAPRHPPCALRSLDQKRTRVSSLWSFQGARGTTPACRQTAARRSLKTQQCSRRRGRHVSRRARAPDGAREPHRTGRTPTGVIAPVFPRKEVIQPQLPLRLPCYDFTPIIDPTFDGSLPCGLGNRLRVLPTFVV